MESTENVAMKRSDISFPSYDGKSTIHALVWEPEGLEGDPRGIIQIIHGMTEHVGRYEHVAQFFVNHGYVVCGHDQIGHGKSVTDKSEWGVLPVENGLQILVDDTHRMRRTMERRFGFDVPFFLYGHSMGSFVLRAYLSMYGDGLEGAIISGTAHNPVQVCSLGKGLAKQIAARNGADYYSKTLNGMADGAYAGAVANARTNYDWLTHDDAVVDAYIADEACGFPFKAGGYVTLMELCEYIAKSQNIKAIPQKLPLLFVAGMEDPVGANGSGVQTVFNLFKNSGHDFAKLMLYENMRHEIHNEFEKEQVFYDLLNWVEVQRLAKVPIPIETKFLVSLDQGTTASRTFLIDHDANIINSFREKFEQHYPQPGWVEHDAEDIWHTQYKTLMDLCKDQDLSGRNVAAVSITNQRETTIIWNRVTGKPICNAIVWQCRRTAAMVEEICGDPKITEMIVNKTGLTPDAYFCASKIKWILDNVEGAREDALAGKLAFGTVDCWLVYKLTGGEVHATDYTNASRTMLYNIHTLEWDQELLDLFDIPREILPEVRPSAAFYGKVAQGPLEGVPIYGVVGDQQSALFGQCCFEEGQAKSTYGTGCFLLMNTGTKPCASKNGLVTTIAASAPGEPITYALEGSVYNCATLIQWVRDSMKLYVKSYETEALAKTVEDNGGVYIVPAFTGLGAPYWDADARGAILGITRGVTGGHIARATLEAVGYQLYDLLTAMEADAGYAIEYLNVDGGVTDNDLCMQFQSDILQKVVRRPQNKQTTGMGAAYLAGLACGYFENKEYLKQLRLSDTVFEPTMSEEKRVQLLAGWKDAVKRVLTK